MIWVGLLFGGARKALSAAFAFLGNLSPATLALLALALFAGLQTWRVGHVVKQRDLATMQVQRMTTVLNESRARIEAAGAKAAADAKAKNARYAQAKKDADHDLAILSADYRSRAARYADTHRVRISAATNIGNPGGVPETPAAPEGPDRASDTAVILGRDDFDILVANTARLKAAHDWAQGLLDPR